MKSINIREKLLSLAEPEYKAFAARLLPKDTILYGVRLPYLKKIAKEAAKEKSFELLQQVNYDIFEEKLICGFFICYIKMPLEEKFGLIRDFVPKIDNWSVCDSFCAALLFKDEQKERVFEFLQPYLVSESEYEARFGIVMLLDHFIDTHFINRVLKVIKELNAEGYYAKMAAAWALSVCLVHFPDKTTALLEEGTLSTFIHNKAIQKSLESYRINKDIKEKIKKLKK